MTGKTTSPLVKGRPSNAPSITAKEEWRRYLAFLKRPALPHHIAPGSTAVKGTLRIFGLDLMITAAFIALLLALVASGIELPENLNSTLEMNLMTVALVVIIAPVLEEIAFRSWLSGQPRYLAGITVMMIGGLAAGIAAISAGSSAPILPGLILIAGFILAVVAAFVFWKRPTPSWFVRLFPILFWLSSAAFALVHLFNYTAGALIVLLPLVVPQLVLGTMAGYVRVQYGLVFAILLHAAHNGFAISVASFSMSQS